MNNSTNIRIRSGSVSFYTTAENIQQGVGDCVLFNNACVTAMNILNTMRKTDTIPPRGMSGTWNGIQIQIDIIK